MKVLEYSEVLLNEFERCSVQSNDRLMNLGLKKKILEAARDLKIGFDKEQALKLLA